MAIGREKIRRDALAGRGRHLGRRWRGGVRSLSPSPLPCQPAKRTIPSAVIQFENNASLSRRALETQVERVTMTRRPEGCHSEKCGGAHPALNRSNPTRSRLSIPTEKATLCHHYVTLGDLDFSRQF